MTHLTELQIKALKKAHHKPGYLFALEMGLGKTLLALAEFLNLVNEDKRATRMVVVAPNSFKSGWAREIDKHQLQLAVHIYSASKHAAAEAFVRTKYTMPPVLIVNYEAVRLAKVRKLLADFTYRRNVYLVCDESINLKNPTAKRTKALHGMAPQFAFVRCLSGRPTTQGPHDLWGQLTMVGALRPGESFYQFRGTYCVMGGWENRQVMGGQNLDQLRERMRDHVLVAKKRDWLTSLPEKSYTTREYELKGVLATEYARMEQDFMAYIRSFEDKTKVVDRVEAAIALTKYGKLLQIMCGFIHDEDGEPQWLVEDGDNPRLQLLLETLETNDTKMCVCFRHRFVGEQLQRALADYNPVMLEGGMRERDIEAAKDDFNLNPECRVILLQLDAAKFGHTLLGNQMRPEDACNTMIFYENSYSLDTRAQIEDRIHRIGQQNACLYIDFVGSEMDARVVKALQFKQHLFESLFGR